MDTRAYAPHCDQRVLHAPKQCIHCDEYPDWQESRRVQGIAFTGNVPVEREIPCPSQFGRKLVDINAWDGNTPKQGIDDGTFYGA